MLISIAAQDFGDFRSGSRVPSEARLRANRQFKTDDGIFVLAGSDQSRDFYQRFAVSMEGTIIRVEAGTAYATTNSSDPTVRYTLDLYDEDGALIRPLLTHISISHEAPTTTWGVISEFSTGTIQQRPVTYLDSNAILAILEEYKNAIPAGPGGGSFTLASVLNGIDNIIAHFATSTVPVLMDVNVTVSSPKTFSSATRLIPGGGRFVKSGSGTITFQGVGLTEPESRDAIFSGFGIGDVTWTGTTSATLPAAISTELWDTGNVSLTDRVARADAAFPTQYAKIVCHPRTMTATIPLHQNRLFYFMPGDYLNTSSSGHAIFWFDSNTTFTGTRLARLHESTIDYNDSLFGPKNDALYDSYHDVHVFGLTFVGNLATAASPSSTVILGNCINGSIRDNEFHETKTYVTLGGAGDTGNYAENSEISDNLFTRVPNQQAVILNGKNCKIARNTFDMRGVYWTNPATGLPDSTNVTLVDLESNGELDIVENIIIEENLFDCRNIGKTFRSFFGGISVAGDGLNRSIIVRNNTFLSGNLQNNGDNVGPGTLSNAVRFRGVLEGYVYGNTVRGANVPISLTESNDVRVFNNVLESSYDGLGDGNSISVRSCQDCKFYLNDIDHSKLTDPIYVSGIFEYEQLITVSTAAQLITRQASGSPGKFYPHMAGDAVVINNAVFHIESIWSLPETESNTAKTLESLPTLNRLSMVPGDISSSVFHKVAHGFANGARVQVVFDVQANRFAPDLPISHPDAVVTAFLIRVDADNFKLATTQANALAGTFITITSAGTSNFTVYPVLEFQRSRNRFRDNRTRNGVVLSKTALQTRSDSLILSCAEDDEITEVANTNYTVARGDGIVLYTSLTAGRTVNLPDATICRGKKFVVKDGTGNAASFNITLDGLGAQTIDGAATKAIATNFGSLRIKSDGQGWLSY